MIFLTVKNIFRKETASQLLIHAVSGKMVYGSRKNCAGPACNRLWQDFFAVLPIASGLA
jgi:hypothetical protein